MTTKLWPVLVALVAVQGCDDLLTETPKDFLTPENFYQTSEDATSAVLSIYKPLVHNSAFQHRIWSMTDAASDVAQIGPLEPTADIRSGGIMNYDAATTTVTAPWGQLYLAAGRANLAIERIPGIKMPAAENAALVGEAKFLRALIYFYLVRLYGDVPLVLSTTGDEEVARTPTEEVYRQIVADAGEAAGVLPASWNAAHAGRATRGAARTLLADVALTRRDWQRAADQSKQVIDSRVYSLAPDFLRAFLPTSENGPEHVFSLQAEGPALATTSAYAAIYFPREVGRGQGGGNGSVQPTMWHYNSYLAGDYRREVGYSTRWTNVANGRVFNVTPHVFKFRPSQVTQIGSG
ncbi:MAG: RagB/SusD family nutrient uptake outer membrane protein, partial [Gemmatimonadetes bacterium]|nr:RagB/SusD family nutrient uptake outer membrane protein [Gemmatimonadota bacterium]